MGLILIWDLSVWFFSVHFNIPLQSKDIHVKMSGYSKLSIGENGLCLSCMSLCDPVCWAGSLSGVYPAPGPITAGDRHQFHTKNEQAGKGNGWMDKLMYKVA